MFYVWDPRFSTQPALQARCFPWRDTAGSCLHELVGRMETLFCHTRHNALPHISFCLPDKWTVEGNLLHSISFSSYGWLELHHKIHHILPRKFIGFYILVSISGRSLDLFFFFFFLERCFSDSWNRINFHTRVLSDLFMSVCSGVLFTWVKQQFSLSGSLLHSVFIQCMCGLSQT